MKNITIKSFYTNFFSKIKILNNKKNNRNIYKSIINIKTAHIKFKNRKLFKDKTKNNLISIT